MLSLQFTRPGHGRRVAALASLMPSFEAREAFMPFMLTLLGRRVAAAPAADALAERHAIEDLWKDPLVRRRWQRLALRLTADDCERICRSAVARGLAGNAVRWLTETAATDGWALESGGYASEGKADLAAVPDMSAAATVMAAGPRHLLQRPVSPGGRLSFSADA